MSTFSPCPPSLPQVPTESDFLARFSSILPPTSSNRSRWYRSRVAVNPDGSLILVLRAMALAKFGEYDRTRFDAYWIDGNWENETFSNVSLISHRQKQSLNPPTPSGSRFPSDTPEYHREYYRRNKDKIRGSQKSYYQRRKDRMAALEAEVAAIQAAPAGVTNITLEHALHDKFETLRKLLGADSIAETVEELPPAEDDNS